jgi:hypothetical protein
VETLARLNSGTPASPPVSTWPPGLVGSKGVAHVQPLDASTCEVSEPTLWQSPPPCFRAGQRLRAPMGVLRAGVRPPSPL